MTLIGTKMVEDGRTSREIFEEVMGNPARKKFGFGEKLAIVNVDLQQAYTRTDMFKTAYETDPKQIDYINRISAMARAKHMPVIWSRVAYKDDAGDAGIWGTRTDTEDSLQNIKYDSERHKLDPRCEIGADDLQYTKRMPSAFLKPNLPAIWCGTKWIRLSLPAARPRAACGRRRWMRLVTAIARLYRSKPAPTSMEAIILRI